MGARGPSTSAGLQGGERIIRKKEKKYLSPFPRQYKLHYLISRSPVPRPRRGGPRPSAGDQTSAVTCQSSSDRQWPCTALLETIWIDLAFLIRFRCWFPWQLACKRGAMPNKIGLIGSRISWFYGVGAWGAGPEMFMVFFSIGLSRSVEALSCCTMFLTVIDPFT